MWLNTVVLRHDTAEGEHYDWLLDPPPGHALPEQRLWAARVEVSPEQWLAQPELGLRLLPPHRRLYLTYEGPLSAGRGRVKRVASGGYCPRLWTHDQLQLTVRMQEVRAEVRAMRVGGDLWRMVVLPEEWLPA